MVRLRDPCGHLAYRAFVYDGYRAQHNSLQLATSAICCLLVLPVHLATTFVSIWPLIPASVLGIHLTSGVILVVRNIDTMRYDSEEIDPCWQALVLSVAWPAWVVMARIRLHRL